MPNDPIAPGAPAPAPAAPAAPDYASREDLTALRGELAGFSEGMVNAVRSMNEQLGSWSQQFQPTSQPAPAKPAAPAAGDPDENGILMRIARGDLSPLDERVVHTLKETGLVSFLATQANNSAAANEASARAAIDTEYGEGTYEKQLKPVVDSLLGKSVSAWANPQTFQNALAAAKGQKLAELFTARGEREKKAAETRAAEESRMRNAPWMPGNGWAPTQQNVLSEDDGARLRRIVDQTGHGPKPEEAAKMRDLLWQKGHDGVSMEELAALFPNQSK